MTAIETLQDYLSVPSCISDHGEWCCRVARSWFVTMDSTFATDHGREVPPVWLAERFRWGPCLWPLYWCELTKRETLDCGALAAATTTIMRARGVEACTAQIIQRYDAHVLDGWQAVWTSAGVEPRWIKEDLVYHECTAVLRDRSVVLWDPSENRWLEAEWSSRLGGAIVSIRVASGPAPWDGLLRFGNLPLVAGEWTVLDFGRPTTKEKVIPIL